MAAIEIFDEYLAAVSDIKPGDIVILLTWLHKADRTVLKTRPRNNPSVNLTGVFSTRSPDRPNPVGFHEAIVVAFLKPNLLEVSAHEVLDQTPLIDIKSMQW